MSQNQGEEEKNPKKTGWRGSGKPGRKKGSKNKSPLDKGRNGRVKTYTDKPKRWRKNGKLLDQDKVEWYINNDLDITELLD